MTNATYFKITTSAAYFFAPNHSTWLSSSLDFLLMLLFPESWQTINREEEDPEAYEWATHVKT
jgi:hypothetical protein